MKNTIEIVGASKEFFVIKDTVTDHHTIIKKTEVTNYNVANNNHLVFLLDDNQNDSSHPR